MGEDFNKGEDSEGAEHFRQLAMDKNQPRIRNVLKTILQRIEEAAKKGDFRLQIEIFGARVIRLSDWELDSLRFELMNRGFNISNSGDGTSKVKYILASGKGVSPVTLRGRDPIQSLHISWGM